MAKNDLAKADADKAETPKSDDTAGLVKVSKAGETLHVHPTTLGAHQKQGWKVVE